MKKYLIILFLLSILMSVAEARPVVCLYDSGATCTVSMSALGGSWSDIWTTQATTEHAVGGKSVYVKDYSADFDPTLSYYVTCSCSGIVWSYAYDLVETRQQVATGTLATDAHVLAIPTTSAPTAAAIRQELDSNSTKLANLDTNIASRAPASTALSSNTWTSQKATYLDAAMTSRAAASTALNSTTWTSLRASYLDMPISAVQGGQGSTFTPADFWSFNGVRSLNDKVGFGILDEDKTAIAQRAWDNSYVATRALTTRKIKGGDHIARQETLITLGNGANPAAQLPVQGVPTLPTYKNAARDMTFGLAMDLTGQEVWFIAKATPLVDDSTAIINKQCDIIDIESGTIGVHLTTTETGTVGSYYARIEVRGAGEGPPLVVRQYNLKVINAQ